MSKISNIKKENKNLENKYELNNNQLNEGIQKYKIQENVLKKQQEEYKNLTKKLVQMKLNIENKKVEVILGDDKNKKLMSELKEL